jgi:hypothetical protein
MEPRKNVNVSGIVNYKWKEILKLEFIENLKSNEFNYVWVIYYLLYKSTIDRTLNILYFVIKKARHKIKFSGRK